MRHKLLQEAATAGSSLRYESALRVMCDSGSRVSEACGVTMENWWRGSRFGTAIDSPSKGSGDVPVKVLSLSKDTAKALRTYVDTERRRLDPEGRGLEEFELLGRRGDLPHSTPIFLTRNRTQLSPEQFRNQFFNPLARRAGFDISPHGTRHNFVSLALDEIDLVADTPARRQMLREELVSLLAWAQGDRMLKVYDRRSKGRRILEVIERVREKQDSAPVARVGSTELAADAQPSVISKIMGRPT
ncbi:site-specific integrase [Panacagrimonas perspica]|nr:site-specific integrase [Panacagrimonas perspica]